MPPPSRHTNFTALKAPAFCFCDAEFRLRQFSSAARTKISDVPGRKIVLELRGWQQRLSLWNEIANRSRSAKKIYGINFGRKFPRKSRRRFSTATLTGDWQIPWTLACP